MIRWNLYQFLCKYFDYYQISQFRITIRFTTILSFKIITILILLYNYSNIKEGIFCKNSWQLLAVTYSRKKLHIRFSTAFWIHFCNDACQTTFSYLTILSNNVDFYIFSIFFDRYNLSNLFYFSVIKVCVRYFLPNFYFFNKW